MKAHKRPWLPTVLCSHAFTCLQVTFSRSWHVMMLLSLALIRHSVLSLSDGLKRHSNHAMNPSWHIAFPAGICLRVGSWPCLLVDKHDGWIWPWRLQVLHGVPLVNAALVGSDAAFVVAHPGESYTSREIVKPARNFASFVQHLQGGPGHLFKNKITYRHALVKLFKIHQKNKTINGLKPTGMRQRRGFIPVGGIINQLCLRLHHCSSAFQ